MLPHSKVASSLDQDLTVVLPKLFHTDQEPPSSINMNVILVVNNNINKPSLKKLYISPY